MPGARRNRRAFPQKSESTLLHHVVAYCISFATAFSFSKQTPSLPHSVAPPYPNRTRCAGLRFGELAASFFKTRRALILLLLAFTVQTLLWFARRWRRGCRFFIKTSSARFLAPPDPNRIRCAGPLFWGACGELLYAARSPAEGRGDGTGGGRTRDCMEEQNEEHGPSGDHKI